MKPPQIIWTVAQQETEMGNMKEKCKPLAYV